MNNRVLIIDDDTRLNKLLSDYLKGFSFEVQSATHPEKGLKLLEKDSFDIVLLDVMLPGEDGFSVCQKIRRFSQIPIIMLTARGEITDRVVGLEIGADDYVAKPFEPREIVARIQAILRRSKAQPERNGLLLFDELQVDLVGQRIMLKGNEITLTTMEFAVLQLFVANAGQVIGRDQIVESIKGDEFEPFNRSVDILISRLRQKLGDDAQSPRYLKTIWGRGYMFIGTENN